MTPFASLREAHFARFAAGMVVANSGLFLFSLTTPFLVNELTDSNAWVGASGFVALFPAVFATPVAGILADRMDRRLLLVAAFAVQVVLMSAFALLYAADVLTPWRILGLQALLGIVNGFQFAPIQSMAAVLVPGPLLISAVRLTSIMFTVSRALGPATAGVILATAGPGLAYVIVVACTVFGLVSLLTIRTRPQALAEQRSFVREFRSGLAYIRARPSMRLAVASAFVVAAFAAVFAFSLAPSVADDVFEVGGGGLGTLVTMVGAGSILGSVYISGAGGLVARSRLYRVALVTYGVGVLVLASTSVFGVGLFGYLLLGVAHMWNNVTITTSLQVQVDEPFRGRVMSVWLLAILAGVPLGALAGGFLAGATSVRTVLVLYGSVVLGYTVVTDRIVGFGSLDDQLAAYD